MVFDVLVEGAAEVGIQQLNAAADGENWGVAAQSVVKETALQRVAGSVGLVCAVDGGISIDLRGDVSAASENQAVVAFKGSDRRWGFYDVYLQADSTQGVLIRSSFGDYADRERYARHNNT